MFEKEIEQTKEEIENMKLELCKEPQESEYRDDYCKSLIILNNKLSALQTAQDVFIKMLDDFESNRMYRSKSCQLLIRRIKSRLLEVKKA